MEKKYSFWIGLKKVLLNLIIVGVPLVLQILPSDILNLTVSGILLLILNYIKVNYAK